MKRKIILLDDESANLLAKEPNASETVRQALKVYNEHISTDTLAGMRKAFTTMQQSQTELEQSLGERMDYLTEVIEKLNSKLGEASNGY